MYTCLEKEALVLLQILHVYSEAYRHFSLHIDEKSHSNNKSRIFPLINPTCYPTGIFEIPRVFENFQNPILFLPHPPDPTYVKNPTSHPTYPTWEKVYGETWGDMGFGSKIWPSF